MMDRYQKLLHKKQEAERKLAEMKPPRPWKGGVSSFRGKVPASRERLRFLLHSSPPLERRGILKREIKPKLSHPHGDAQSIHDLADQEFRVWSAYLDELEEEIGKLEFERRKKK